MVRADPPPGVPAQPGAGAAMQEVGGTIAWQEQAMGPQPSNKKVIADANSQAAKVIARTIQSQRRASMDDAADSRRASVATAGTRRSSLSSMSAYGDKKPNHGKKNRCCSCVGCLSSIFSEDVGRKEDDSDSDVSEDDSEEGQLPQIRKKASNGKQRLQEKALAQIRLRVLEKLGVPEDEDLPWPLHLRLQRACGLLQIRTIIGIKRIRVEEEPPDFPGARYIVSSLKFEAVVGVLIFLNSAMIGWDTMFKNGESKPWILLISEYIFTFIFVVEFILRIMAYSWVWIFSPMNIFDAFVVWIVGVLTTYILIPFGANMDIIQRLAALRILRLARLCRAIRMIPVFHELWMLVKGVMECMSLLFWAGVIIGTVHFMFAVATLELVVKTEQFKDDPLVNEYFGGLLPAMFTLFQIMTFDSWAFIIRPIIYREPATAVLFFFFMGIAGIVLFNLMTAIVVKNSFDAITEDEEAMAQLKHLEHQKMNQELREMFKDMDDDNSGTLSQEEFTDVLDDVAFIRKMKMMDIDLEELPDIFEILDDGDGQVSMDEFCMGLMRMQGVAMSRDTLKATHRLKRINDGFTEISQEMEHYSEDVCDNVENALDSSHENFLEMQALIAELLKQLNQIGIRKVVHESTAELPKLPEPTIGEILNETKRAAAAAEEQEERRESNPNRRKNSMEPDLSLPGAMVKPIPPAWISRRREEEKQARREKNKTVARARKRLQEPEEEEAPPEEPLGPVAMEFQEEWNRLEVKIEVPPLHSATSPLRLTASGKGNFFQTLSLPGGLVAPANAPVHKPVPIGAPLPVAVPPPLPPRTDELRNLPNAVPQDDSTTLV